MNAKTKNLLFWVGVVLAIGVLFWLGRPNPEVKSVVIDNPEELPGIQTGEAPWEAEVSRLSQRLAKIGLPALAQEAFALHIHQHLDIFIDGKPVPVPTNIGISRLGGFISILHTHDDTGLIHIESPTVETFTLGQFFDVWGVRFTKECIGGYCATPEKSLKIYVNGKEAEGDPRTIALDSRQQITVVYGQPPQTIPSSYTFAPGL